MMNLFNMLLGPNTGINVDDMTMAQKRGLYGSMFDPMEAGRERLRAMTAPETGAAMGGGNPMLALSALQGLLSPQQPQFMPLVQQQVTPGLNLQVPSMNNFYGGLL